MATKIFLVRHSDYIEGGSDPILSEKGKTQSLELANSIKAMLDNTDVVIWSSSANRAQETADIISCELQDAQVIIQPKLWSDKFHHEDFNWLKQMIDEFQGENLIIVSHLEYVRLFPEILGYSRNQASYGEGVLICNGKCEFI